MQTLRSLPSWLNSLIVVSLLLAFVPASAEASPSPKVGDVSLDMTRVLPVPPFLPVGDRITSRSQPGETLLTANAPDLVVLPGWWSVTAGEDRTLGASASAILPLANGEATVPQQMLSPLQSEDEVYYLSDESYTVYLSHSEDDDDWTRKCFETQTEADLVAVLFRVSRGAIASASSSV
jgi:hypothetical protein